MITSKRERMRRKMLSDLQDYVNNSSGTYRLVEDDKINLADLERKSLREIKSVHYKYIQ
jgi:hypothetical protein